MRPAWFPFLTFAAIMAAQQPGTITIDSQKWLDTPLKHLEVRGTLNGDTLFEIRLPPREAWKGRAIQYLAGGLGGALNGVQSGYAEYALANGAVFVESTQGHIGTSLHEDDDTPTEIAYEASYAVMQYAKARCVEIYGKEPRFSYVFGVSGGGVRTTGLFERFPKVYDGAVPVVGADTLKAHVYQGSLFDYYQPVLRDKVDAIVDAVGPGGTGDPFIALSTPEEKEALRAVLTAGLPRLAIGSLRQGFASGILLLSTLRYKFDPGYFDDFSKFGFGWHNLKARVVDKVEGIIKSAEPEQLVLLIDSIGAPANLYGYTMTFTTGKLAGQWRYIRRNSGPKLEIAHTGPGIAGVAPGDRFFLGNRDLLAWLHYHRHIADPDDISGRQFYQDRKPRYSQRQPAAMQFLDETDRTPGKISGKMIAVFGSEDPIVWPAFAARYHRAVRKQLGAAAENHFRIHFIERSPHGNPPPETASRQVSKSSAVYKALDDVMAWVESGTVPAKSTEYELDSMNQLVTPPTAALRRGYQPVVRFSANGRKDHIVASVNQEVRFQADAEDPDNDLTKAEIDFEGDDRFDQSLDLRGRTAVARFTFRYQKPGVYSPAVRVTDATASIGSRVEGIQNLAALRVVVR